LRILNIIKEDALCVGEIQTLLGITQSNASRHLEKIKTSGIVNTTKKAQFVFYMLTDKALRDYSFLKKLLFVDLCKVSVFIADIERLKKYKNSGLECQDLRDAGFDFKKLNL
jgi:ArsR family transcriptional regulator